MLLEVGAAGQIVRPFNELCQLGRLLVNSDAIFTFSEEETHFLTVDANVNYTVSQKSSYL